MRLYEQRAEKEGRKDDHAFAKEILAGIAGASVDGESPHLLDLLFDARIF
jgi:hypothetical protein